MHVAVVGAGAVGLCSAWYLKDYGLDVSVFDSARPGNGASWGNAGQILPAKAVPLSEPGNLVFALKSLLKKNSPITAPKTFDKHLLNYFRHFIINSAPQLHRVGSLSMLSLGQGAIREFEYMEQKGVTTTRNKGPFTAAFTKNLGAEKMMKELEESEKILGQLDFETLNHNKLTAREPLLQNKFKFGVQLNNQSYIHPPNFIENLVRHLREHGVDIEGESKVEQISAYADSISLEFKNGSSRKFDYVVVATGAWLNSLTHKYGVRHPVIAGTGYSLAVDVPHQTQGMLYLPDARIATTNYGSRLRVSSFMQMSHAGLARDPKKIAKLVSIAKKEIPDAKWSTANEFWSGGRPLSGDGKPLIGKTNHPRVYVNSGHGMWGVTLAPVSARKVAENIVEQKPISVDFDPLR